ncbi:arabinose-proton symporter [Asticcacaulis biprosthecium C19]|uniref:Arabinose-proton symporter n=1 Tax=Asticcacaulis biprosthecium C19 TaxID=715226 RepID=F4QLL0_9CAUL|nr:sugar porter family MFS transporter [Asticcacaulis biprosthecium]EGF93508.1 arabinose-proton symporter [Asticcacaulis biprosthecium C19]
MKINLTGVFIASLAGLLFGFDTAVISGVTGALRDVFALDDAALGWAVSVALWGTFLGALFMGRLGDAIGGRDALRVIGAMYVVATLGCAMAWNIESFVVCRFILGLAVGGSSVLAPVYISEIVPAKQRGALVGLFQFNIVFGILLAYLSNYIVGQVIEGDAVWRWKVGLAAVPSAVFFALLFLIGQSARWLAAKGRIAEAVANLKKLGISDAETTIAEFSKSQGVGKLSWAQHKKPILLVLLLALFNQLTGINAILYYLNDIFAAAGFNSVSADMQSIAVGGANLIATMVGMTFIDRFGRKKLLVIGAAGVTAALAGVAVIMGLNQGQAWLLPLLILFIVSFAFSQGAVIWVYMSEIFPTPVRATGQSLGSATHWVANAVISLVFPIVATQTKALPFVFFAVCTLVQLIVVARFFPETKGVELEEMEQKL